jgi:probable phosphomutase (TIGR03848 family)
MTTLLLLRHGRTTANASGVLAGWTPGVGLDEIGRGQAAAVAARLAPVGLAAVVSSPLDRCQETATALLASTDDRMGECRYGDWTGRPLKELAKDPLWKVVQQHPSAVVFPGPAGEALAHTQARAVAAVRDWNARIAAEHGPDAVWVACSHGDVIKAVLADALGMHLDLFQRLVVDPCSVSVVRYTETRPFVVRVNDVGGDVAALVPPKRKRRRARADSDAVVGGGAGGPAAVSGATGVDAVPPAPVVDPVPGVDGAAAGPPRAAVRRAD